MHFLHPVANNNGQFSVGLSLEHCQACLLSVIPAVLKGEITIPISF